MILVLGLIAGAAPKAVAADIDDHSIWFDLLDYGAFPDSRSFDVYGSRDFQVPLPYQLGLYYVDVLVQSSGAITSASAGGSSLNNSLSVYSIGNGLYRIQGSLPHVYYDSLRFT